MSEELKLHEFAEAILHYYQGEVVEINTGEKRTKQIMDQFEHEIQYVIRGKVIDAVGAGVMVECDLTNGNKKEILVNAFSIKSISKLDLNFSIANLYWDADRKRTNK